MAIVPSETEKDSDLPPEESLIVKIDPDTIDSGSIEIRDGLKYVKGENGNRFLAWLLLITKTVKKKNNKDFAWHEKCA